MTKEVQVALVQLELVAAKAHSFDSPESRALRRAVEQLRQALEEADRATSSGKVLSLGMRRRGPSGNGPGGAA